MSNATKLVILVLVYCTGAISGWIGGFQHASMIVEELTCAKTAGAPLIVPDGDGVKTIYPTRCDK
jgi:hypothetical protein